MRGVTIYFYPSCRRSLDVSADGAGAAAAAARTAGRAHREVRVAPMRKDLLPAHRRRCRARRSALRARSCRPAAALVDRRGGVRHRLHGSQRAGRQYRARFVRPRRLVRARRLCGGVEPAATGSRAASSCRRCSRLSSSPSSPLFSGALILRRRGVYFSLLTLALTALLFAIAYRWTDFTGGESGLGGIMRATVLGARSRA